MARSCTHHLGSINIGINHLPAVAVVGASTLQTLNSFVNWVLLVWPSTLHFFASHACFPTDGKAQSSHFVPGRHCSKDASKSTKGSFRRSANSAAGCSFACRSIPTLDRAQFAKPPAADQLKLIWCFQTCICYLGCIRSIEMKDESTQTHMFLG